MSTGDEQPPAGELQRMGDVDKDPRAHRATEVDEGQVLAELYGPPDSSGFYSDTGA